VVAGIVIVFGLFFGISQLMDNDGFDAVTTYNFFEFVKMDNIWYTQWQKDDNLFTVSMRYNPYEIEDLAIVGELDESFNRPEAYVTFHPQKGNFTIISLAAGELSLNMFRALGVKPIASCMINDTKVCGERPIVTCEKEGISVIQIVDKGEPAVILDGDCIQLQGEGMGLLKSVDRLLYQWYGIMK